MSEELIIPDGDAIKKQRSLKGLTQELLAEMTGLGLRTIQKAESSKRVHLDTIKTIAEALGTNYEHFHGLEERNKAVMREVFSELFNRNQIELINKLYAKDIVSYDPGYGARVFGRDQLRNLLVQFQNAFPGIQYRMEDIIAERDKVAVHWTAVATHEGEFAGIQGTGNRIDVFGVSICKLVEGQIQEIKQVWNLHDIIEQIRNKPNSIKVQPHVNPDKTLPSVEA